MRIKLDVKTFDKPLDKPRMIMKAANPNELSLVMATGIQVIERQGEPKKKKPKFSKPSFKLGMAPARQKSFRVQPVPSTKNDKVNLLIEAFSNSYREIAQYANDITYTKEGLHIPQQDKCFFEMLLLESLLIIS